MQRLRARLDRVEGLQAKIDRFEVEEEAAARLGLILPAVCAGVAGEPLPRLARARRNAAAHCFTEPAARIATMNQRDLNRLQRRDHEERSGLGKPVQGVGPEPPATPPGPRPGRGAGEARPVAPRAAAMGQGNGQSRAKCERQDDDAALEVGLRPVPPFPLHGSPGGPM